MAGVSSSGGWKQRLAAGLMLLFALQSSLRLILLIPLHGSDRDSAVFHAWGLVALAAFSAGALVLARGRRWGQIALAAVLAAFGVVATVYDVTAFVTGIILHKSLSLAAIGSFYCSEQTLAHCAAQYWHVTALIAGWAVLWAAAIVWCADAMAVLANRWSNRLRTLPLLPRWFDPRHAIALATAAYAGVWLVFPTSAGPREPIYGFLTKRAFVQGPVELVSLPRPDYRVSPTPGAKPRPLVLITVDSLRSDSVQLGLGSDSLTPFLRELAGTGKLHDLGPATAICGSSYCGIVALQSSSDWATQQRGPPLTLPDVLAANGYRSIFLLSGPHRTAKNLGALYGPAVTILMDDASEDSSGLSDDREQVQRLRRVAIADPAQTYLSIHLMSAHVGGRRFGGAPRDVLDYGASYRGGVRQADRIIREIFAILRARGLLDDALVVITADHGERIGKVEPGHLARIDRATTAIPLVIYDARKERWPVQPLASQLDVAPTLLAGAGIGIPPTWRGKALQAPFTRTAAPVDSSDVAGMAALVGGRRLLFLCNLRSGATEVRAFGLPDLTAAERASALVHAPALYGGLARRRDAARCFSPAGAAQPRS